MSSFSTNPPSTQEYLNAQRYFPLPLLKSFEHMARQTYPHSSSLAHAVNSYIRYNTMFGAYFYMDGTRFMRCREFYYSRLCKPFYPSLVYKFDKRYRFLLYENGSVIIDQREIETRQEMTRLRVSLEHSSERGMGWAKPFEKGQRHLFNLPLEILEKIFRYVLVLPQDRFGNERMVAPNAVTSNLYPSGLIFPNYKMKVMKMGFPEREFRIDNEFLPSVAFAFVGQENWQSMAYYSIPHIRLPPIDPAVLCIPLLNQIACRILYGNNTFSFKMANRYHGWLATMDQNLQVYRPKPHKPSHWRSPPTDTEYQRREAQISRKISEGIRQIQDRVDRFDLFGWIYYDPFLRFLHLIGPHNCALIKKLAFEGIPIIHSCTRLQCIRCDDDLISSLRIYVKFIVALCPSLQKLALYVRRDELAIPFPPAFDELQSEEEALLPFLKNELREITTLRELAVVGYGVDVGFADATIEWVKDAAKQRVRESRTAAAERSGEMKKVPKMDFQVEVMDLGLLCDFCKATDHVWPSCYNLCPFCGRYGHLRDNCRRWQKSRVD